MLFRHAVVAATLLSLTACTTMQPVQGFTPATAQQEIHVGDQVRVVLAGGAVYELEVTKVEADSFVGRADTGKHWRIKYDAIKLIESEQASAGKTAGAVGGGLTILLYVAAIALAVILFDVVDTASGD